jgi:hypothetical protein
MMLVYYSVPAGLETLLSEQLNGLAQTLLNIWVVDASLYMKLA